MTLLPIEIRALEKRFGAVDAVAGVTFSVAPGRVTGFLGANGAGKTTTLRILLGLVAPTAGQALVRGRHYADLSHPTRIVGAMVDLAGAHPRMTARQHLRVHATLAGIPAARVDIVLEQCGATTFADRRIGTYSTGMRQRLALAFALLGDPEILVLDEPSNGLDPAGMAWLRGFLAAFAASGRSVLLSSHVLAEVEAVADDVVLIDHGRLLGAGTLADITAGATSLENAYLRTVTEGALS